MRLKFTRVPSIRQGSLGGALTYSETLKIRFPLSTIRMPLPSYKSRDKTRIGLSAVCSDSRPSNSSSFLLSWDCFAACWIVFINIARPIFLLLLFSSPNISSRPFPSPSPFLPSFHIQNFFRIRDKIHTKCLPHLLLMM